MTRYLVLMFGIGIALINAMLRPVMSGQWHPNYLIMGVLVFAVWQLIVSREHHACQRYDVYAVFILLGALLVPSSQLAWVSLGMFCLWHAWFGSWSSRTRIGLLVLVAAAWREPVGHIVKEWLAEDLLKFDTGLVTSILTLQGVEVAQTGNMLTLAGDHALIVLTGCGSFTNISVACLVWYAVCLIQAEGWQNRFIWSGIMVAGLTVFVNVLRLALLAQGPAWFAYFHDGTGVWIIQTLGFLVIALPVWIQLRHEKAHFSRRHAFAGDDRLDA